MIALEIIIAQEAILGCTSSNTLPKSNHGLILSVLLYTNLNSLSMVSLSDDVGFFVLLFFWFLLSVGPKVYKLVNSKNKRFIAKCTLA